MLDAEGRDYMRGIIGKLCDIEWPSIVCRPADAAVVQQDEFVGRCESINETRIPIRAGRTEAIEDRSGRPLPIRRQTMLASSTATVLNDSGGIRHRPQG